MTIAFARMFGNSLVFLFNFLFFSRRVYAVESSRKVSWKNGGENATAKAEVTGNQLRSNWKPAAAAKGNPSDVCQAPTKSILK